MKIIKMILLSVKPFYLEKILNGLKIIELRKRVGVQFQPNTKIYLYASSPVKAIVGTAYLKVVEKLPLLEATNNENDIFNRACISRIEFNNYFLGCNYCYLLHIESVKQAKSPVCLRELRSIGITPPQSFCYLSSDKTVSIDGIMEAL